MTSKQAKALYRKKLYVEHMKNHRLWKVTEWKERRDTERNPTNKPDRERPYPRMERREGSEDNDEFVIHNDRETEVRRYKYVSSNDEGSTYNPDNVAQGASQDDARIPKSADADEPQIQKRS
ncbi:hypothetical protein MMC27_006801 [Xylographa pallens]|nr:hypothetical protein [Xylographa pallens]